MQGLPSGPVAKTSMFPVQGAQVQYFVRELDPTCTQLKLPPAAMKIRDHNCCHN